MSTANFRPTITRQAVEAHFAEQAYYQSASNPNSDDHLDSCTSARARNYAMSKKLIVLYMENFKMDARQAKEAVERGMAERYKANPWDAPSPIRFQQQWSPRRFQEETRIEPSQSRECTQYSEEQWDLFEKSLK